MKGFPLRSIPPTAMQQTSPVNSSTSLSPVFRKNTTKAAAVRAQTALSHSSQFGVNEDDSGEPAPQDGCVPMRNAYRIGIELIEPNSDKPRR